MRKLLILPLLFAAIGSMAVVRKPAPNVKKHIKIVAPKEEPEETPLATIKPDDPDMVRVAVIDTGFDVNHPMVGALYSVRAQICDQGTSRFNFVVPEGLPPSPDVKDGHGHGTHVAGLIAKYAGLVPFCLMPMKYYDPNGVDINNLTREVTAFKKSIEMKADIINISGGGIAPNTEECAVIKQALDIGIVVVAAAGNEHDDLATRKYWPAMCDPRVIAVTSKQEFDCKSRPTHCGPNFSTDPKIKLAKEDGYDLLSILPGGQYGYMTGTSQSAAIMSGKLANHLYVLRKSEYGKYLLKKAPGWGR